MGSCTSSSTKPQRQDQGKHRCAEPADAAHSEHDAAAPDLVRIQIVSPSPGCVVQLSHQQTVLTLLERAAPHLGFAEADAPLLQLQFSGAVLAHALPLKTVGLSNGGRCIVVTTQDQSKANEASLDESAQVTPAEVGSASQDGFDPKVVRMLSQKLHPGLLTSNNESQASKELATELDAIIQMALAEMSACVQQLECAPCAIEAHKLKGLAGQLYLKEPYDVANKLLVTMKQEGSSEFEVAAAVKHLCGLFDSVVKGELVPDREDFCGKR